MDFGVEKVEIALKLIQNTKVAAIDCILSEFLKHLCYKGKLWLTKIFSSVKNNNIMPKLWREAKVIAI